MTHAAGAMELAGTVGGFIDKEKVQDAVERYEMYHDYHGGKEEDRKANYLDLVKKYYELSTSFYEYGWGESFHFAPRTKGETLRESIRRHEHFITLQLNLRPGMKVLDMGCGIGGPLREIARFSSASITGVNINEYQITRGTVLNQIAGVEKLCNFVQSDFMKMPFPNSSFDGVYGLQSTCHAPEILACYKEVYRVLKPGQIFAVDEWCMTDSYDPTNPEHEKIKVEIMLGDGLPEIRTTKECLDAMKEAGFEILFEKDFGDSPVPWYQPFDPTNFSLASFRLTPIGRIFTTCMVTALEYIGVAPKGSTRVGKFLQKAADGLLLGGKKGIFTAVYLIVGRKPLL